MPTLAQRLQDEFTRRRLTYRRDRIPGGLGDKARASDFDREQVAKGIRVEMEHTSDPHVALEITLDHLSENPRYYDELAKLKLSRMLSREFERVRYAKFVESEHPRDEDGKFTSTHGDTIRNLRQLTKDTGLEHGVLVDSGGSVVGEIERGHKKTSHGFEHQGVQNLTTADMPDGMTQIHTHPNDSPPSKADLVSFYSDSKLSQMVIVGTRQQWTITKTSGYTGRLSGHEIRKAALDTEDKLIVDRGMDYKSDEYDTAFNDEFEKRTGIRIQRD